MSHCSAPSTSARTAAAGKVLLVGNPNVGKSVIFNLLTGSYATVSNYPGTTVEVTRGRLRGLGRRPEVIDTPGINSLTPLSIDEIVTRDILLNEKEYIVVQVIDARNLSRGLRITAELAELGVRVVVALNMVDEALREGIHIGAEKLGDLLGVEVVPTVAVERRGISELFQALRRARIPRFHPHYPVAIEQAIVSISRLLPDGPLGKRGLAVMLLAGDKEVRAWVAERAGEEVAKQIDQIRNEVAAGFAEPLDYVLAQQRWRQVDELADSVTVRRAVSISRTRELASRATMHPVLGPLILLVVLYLMYVIVGKIGAGTVADFMSGTIMGSPPETIMALGDERVPAHVQVQARARLRQTDRQVQVVILGQAPEASLLVTPGPGAPRFLREEASYTVHGSVTVRAPGGMPRITVQMEYPDGRRDVVPVPLVAEAAGRYRLNGSFVPEADGARYRIAIVAPNARSVTLRGLSVQRDAAGLVNPWLYALVDRLVPSRFLRYILVGEYGVITMGLTLAIGIVLPIVVFFFLFFALLEDSGYLARLTVLANRPFTVMGLDGRAVVPMVLGLGCDTMATLAARVLHSPKARLIVIFLLALGVPCSAQLGVVLAMASAIGLPALVLIFGVVLVELFAAGYVANRLLPGPRSDFIVEIPLLRMPLLRNVLRKTWQRAEWFLREAFPYFLLGTLALAVSSWIGLLNLLERAMQPVTSGLLSLPREATYAFLIGFLRRDYGAAGLFDLRYEGRLDNLQTVVALITMTLFVPCIANFLVMIKEQGAKRAVAMLVVIICLALLTGGLINHVLRALGVTL